MTMHFVTVSDANGNDENGLTDNQYPQDDEGRQLVFVFVSKETGFGDTVGQVAHHQLKQGPDGKYVA